MQARANRNVALGLTILRVGTGAVFLLHGWQKLFGDDISFLREMLGMAGWSLPETVWWLVAVLETAGGLALVSGLLTRLASVSLALEMTAAIILFHARQGFFIVAVPNVPLAYGFEYHVILIASLACLALAGPGQWALADRLRATGPGDTS